MLSVMQQCKVVLAEPASGLHAGADPRGLDKMNVSRSGVGRRLGSADQCVHLCARLGEAEVVDDVMRQLAPRSVGDDDAAVQSDDVG